ncbi:MAG TPA: GNAT family N-acetyltransferase [Actinomycetota bacterium]|nr:GNAT family N-acetyltransferase [Actinomycetota bacterium]
MTVVLETERLLVREFEPGDLDAYAALIGDPETMRYYARPFTRDEASDLIERNRARYRAHGFGVWALEERGTGEFLGDCGLAVSLVEGIPEVEVMWHVVRDRWRGGLATEAASAVRDHALGPVGLKRLVALVRPENVPSAGVARKLGMAVERRVRYADRPPA